MESIFRVPWDELRLDDVATFIATAGNEGLTWEAKGTERPHPDSVRKQVSAFANSIGGYLIIGTERDEEAWSLPGVFFPDEEPEAWVSRVVRENGVRPVPSFDVKAWDAEDGRKVAVVQIEPVAVPPCMTRSGEVFERVSGESPKVTDPAVLARLFERGRTAERQAERAALTQAAHVTEHDPGDPPFLFVGLALGFTGKPHDLAGGLFTARFKDVLQETVARLPMEPLFYFAGPESKAKA